MYQIVTESEFVFVQDEDIQQEEQKDASEDAQALSIHENQDAQLGNLNVIVLAWSLIGFKTFHLELGR